MPAAFNLLSAHELRSLIADREVSPVELTRHALDAAQVTQGTLNAFFLVMEDEAMATARAAED
ncbi:MAG TPA: amidase, partial [Ancylobacter sp.]